MRSDGSAKPSGGSAEQSSGRAVRSGASAEQSRGSVVRSDGSASRDGGGNLCYPVKLIRFVLRQRQEEESVRIELLLLVAAIAVCYLRAFPKLSSSYCGCLSSLLQLKALPSPSIFSS